MKTVNIFAVALGMFILSCGSSDKKEKTELKDISAEAQKQMLVFTKTAGYRHESIEKGVETLGEIAAEQNMAMIQTEDSTVFTSENLAETDLVVFLSTTGDILNEKQQEAFKEFIENGGAFLGIHAAADTEYEWPWFGKFIGGYFESHPNNPNVLTATLKKTEDHETTSHFPEIFERTDEWYNYKNLNPDMKVTLVLDESSYAGGTHGDFHPIAWYQEFENGKMYYTGSGHTIESFDEPGFKEHLSRAVQWLMN